MDLLFYGLCFLLLNVNMNGLDLLPDWVGCFLLYRGLGQLAPESPLRANLRGWCGGFGVVSLPLWVATFEGDAALVFGITLAAARMYLLYALVRFLQEVQQCFADTFLDIETLRVRRTLVLSAEAVACAAAVLHMNGLVTGLLWLADVVVSVLFLMAFHRTRLAYRAAQK